MIINTLVILLTLAFNPAAFLLSISLETTSSKIPSKAVQSTNDKSKPLKNLPKIVLNESSNASPVNSSNIFILKIVSINCGIALIIDKLKFNLVISKLSKNVLVSSA